MRAQHLAHADVDGHRAGAAVPARAGRDPRRPAAAAQPQRGQGRAVHRRAPDPRPVAGPAAGLRRVLQLLVHRHLRAAVRLAGRLSYSAADRARPQPAGHAGPRAAQPGPAAQTPRRRRDRRAGRGRRDDVGAAAGLAAHHPTRRRHRRDLCGEGLPARVRQHRLPLLAARPAGRDRRRQAVRLRGQRHRHRRRRSGLLLGVPGGIRLVPRGQHRRRHFAAPDLSAGQRLRRPVPADWSGHVVRREHRLPGRRRPLPPTPGGPTGCRSTTRCGSAATGSICRATATRRRSP